MNAWQRWLRAPHTLWLRRLLFQVHLWLGIGLGLYLLLISVSGSAVVLRPQFSQWFVPSQVEALGVALEGPALELALARNYPGWETEAIPSGNPRRALYVLLRREGEAERSRFFDQYQGRDLGPTFPWPVRAMEWLTRLHDDLLLGRTGRLINGLGGALLLLMLLTGLLIWWQGRARWREGLVVRASAPRGLVWQLHAALGFWSLLLLLAWSLTAIYFAFPEPFNWLIDFLDDDLNDFERPEGWLLLLVKMHFGRFGGLPGRLLWMLLGLLPAILYISGFILWWRRVLRRRLAGPSRAARASAPLAELAGQSGKL